MGQNKNGGMWTTRDEALLKLCFVAALVLVVVCIFRVTLDESKRGTCLRHGFVDITGSPIGGYYCTKKVGGTDIVVPMADLK